MKGQGQREDMGCKKQSEESCLFLVLDINIDIDFLGSIYSNKYTVSQEDLHMRDEYSLRSKLHVL
jgi:hypothetical protein